MNQYAVFHSVDSAYSFPLGRDLLVLRIRVDKNDPVEGCYLIYNAKHQFYLKRKETKLNRCYEDDLYAYYEIKLKLKKYSLAYVFRFVSEGKEYYYSSDGLCQNYRFETSYYNFFQHAFINEVDILKEVSWAKSAVIYEIFVDRFHRGAKEGKEPYINLKWGDLPNPKSFAGGTLEGIREKLTYLKRLGVNTIYLTPVFASVSNHKYDARSYYEIDRQFGGEIKFRELVNEIHRRKMRVILDGVFNHISSESELFQDVKQKGKKSRYYPWFIIYDEDLSKGHYETFSSCAYMPKLNTSHPEVQDFICEIGKYYVKEYHIDGWRLDVSDEVSHHLWKRFRNEIKSIDPEVLITGENWQDGSSYLRGDEFDGIMNYAFTRHVNDLLAFRSLDIRQFRNQLETLRLRYPTQVTNMNWNLLDSHDTYRFFTQVKQDRNRALIGAAIQMFYQGIPCIYYGDELPLEGGYDPDCRRCMDFSKAKRTNDFYRIYRALVRLRSKSKILQYGELELAVEEEFLVLRRRYRRRKLSLIIHLSKEGKTIRKPKIVLSLNYRLDAFYDEGFLIAEEKE